MLHCADVNSSTFTFFCTEFHNYWLSLLHFSVTLWNNLPIIFFILSKG